MAEVLSYRDYQKHPLHVDSPTEYADMLRGHTQMIPLPVSDALDRRVPELPLINTMQQQNTRVSTRVFVLTRQQSLATHYYVVNFQ